MPRDTRGIYWESVRLRTNCKSSFTDWFRLHLRKNFTTCFRQHVHIWHSSCIIHFWKCSTLFVSPCTQSNALIWYINAACSDWYEVTQPKSFTVFKTVFLAYDAVSFLCVITNMRRSVLPLSAGRVMDWISRAATDFMLHPQQCGKGWLLLPEQALNTCQQFLERTRKGCIRRMMPFIWLVLPHSVTITRSFLEDAPLGPLKTAFSEPFLKAVPASSPFTLVIFHA